MRTRKSPRNTFTIVSIQNKQPRPRLSPANEYSLWYSPDNTTSQLAKRTYHSQYSGPRTERPLDIVLCVSINSQLVHPEFKHPGFLQEVKNNIFPFCHASKPQAWMQLIWKGIAQWQQFSLIVFFSLDRMGVVKKAKRQKAQPDVLNLAANC